MPAYKNSNNNTWFCSFYYKDWTGKQIKKKLSGFKTKKEALSAEHHFLSKERPTPDMNFSAIIELYLEDTQNRIKPTTLENKKYLIYTKILPYFKDIKIDAIKVSTVRKWQNKLISDPNNYSQTYLKTIHNQLSAIFNFGKKYYNLKTNPAAICGSMGKKYSDKIEFWTLEEFKTFIEVVSDKLASKVAFTLLFYTGIRSGEMLALTLDDFDFENTTLSINKNYARLNKEDIILDPKTPKSNRIIKIPNFLCSLIKEYVESLYDYQSNERLFEFTMHYLHHEMKRGCKKSGIKKIKIHSLRHSHASLLIELGFDPLLISERLGHDNIQTTLQTYSHLYPNKHEKVSDKLEELK